MRLKTSVTLSEDIVNHLEAEMRPGESRSAALERLVREALLVRARREGDARELALINAHADQLNAEADDVLGYQVEL